MTTPGPAPVAYDDGVHLVGSVLWFDSPRERDLCFVSHARIDRVPPHRRVLCTPATARLAGPRLAAANLLISPLCRPFQLGELLIELFPAGHMLGAASAHVRLGQRSVVYAGDIHLPGARTAERAQVRPCDTLVVACPYGDPAISLPPREEAEARVVDWVGRTLGDGATPVLLADRLGKAQDLIHLLCEAGFRVRAHRAIYEITKIYKALGRSFPGARRFRGTPARDEVLVWPVSLRGSPSIGRMRRPLRLAVCSGRAAFEAGTLQRQHRAQAAFPLSLHSGFPELLDYVRGCGAGRVLLHRGRVEACVAALRAAGIDAAPLTPPEQLSLLRE